MKRLMTSILAAALTAALFAAPVSGIYSGIEVEDCINPSSFYTGITLVQGTLAEVPPYGADYCYAR